MKNALYKLSLLLLGITLTGQLAFAQNPDPEVTVIQPSENGIEWVIGNEYLISWVDNFTQGVNIDLVEYDNMGVEQGTQNIATNVPGSTYTWDILDDGTYLAGDYYKILVSSTVSPLLYNDDSEHYFKLVNTTSGTSISLNQPNNVPSIPINSQYLIAWEDDFEDNVRVELIKYDDNLGNNPVVTELSPMGGVEGTTMIWSIANDPLLLHDYYKIRVSAYNDGGNSDISDDYFALVSTVDGEIEIIQPDIAGIEIQLGSQFLISWNDNLAENVKIELTDAAGLNPVEIAASVPSSTYIWNTATTPVGLTAGTYKIKISSTIDPTIADLSTETFEVSDAANGTVTVLQPSEDNIEWELGNQYLISWIDDLALPVDIELWDEFGAAGAKIDDIATGVIGTTFVWNTATTPALLDPGSYTIKVASSDGTVVDFSDFSFDLVATTGEIEVIQPNIPGIEWVIGNSYLISWTDNVEAPVDIQLETSVPITLAYDEADNYGGVWADGDNEGTGFGAWQITTNGTGSAFLGDPVTDGNIVGMDNPSFGLVANGAEVNTDNVTAFREFSAPMELESTFSFDWGIYGPSGYKSFTLYSNGGVDELIKLHIDKATSHVIYITHDGNTSAVFNNLGTDVMEFSFEYTIDGNLHVQSNSRDGVEPAFDQTYTITAAPDAFSFYAEAQFDDGVNNLLRVNWFNNLRIHTFKADIANDVVGSTYVWNTTGYPAGNHTIRVYNGDIEDFSDNTFELVRSAGGTVTFNQPQAGDIWVHDMAYWIIWEDDFMEPLDVYLRNDAEGVNVLLENDFQGTMFDYTVDNTLPLDDEYYIYIASSTDPGNYNFSSGLFEIVSSMPGTITLNQPNGGELIYQNTQYLISWETDITENVEIVLFDDNGVLPDITLTPPGGVISSTWVWNVGLTAPLTTYKIRVQSSDPNSQTPAVESAAVFEVSVPVAMSVYPNPASDIFNVRFDNQTEGMFNAVIYDRFNNRMLETRLDATTKLHRINIAQLPEGFYFLKMTSGKTVITQKIVVNR